MNRSLLLGLGCLVAVACGVDLTAVPPDVTSDLEAGTIHTDAGLEANAPDAPLVEIDAGPFFPPDTKGPFTIETHLGEIASTFQSVHADYYLPVGMGPFPTVFLRHGYTRDQSNLVGWGEQLASHGFLVVIPSTRDSGNADTGAADLKSAILTTLQRASQGASFLTGKVNTAQVIVGGHSSGGLAAELVAAAHETPIAGLILLDTEASTQGETAATMITIPTVGGFAEPDTPAISSLSCNEEGHGVKTAELTAGPLFAFRVKGASHCDLESNTSTACGIACGSTSADRQMAFQTYVTAFLLATYRCELRALPWINGAIIASDTRIQILDQKSLPVACPK